MNYSFPQLFASHQTEKYNKIANRPRVTIYLGQTVQAYVVGGITDSWPAEARPSGPAVTLKNSVIQCGRI